ANPRSPRRRLQPRCPVRRQALVGPDPDDPGSARPRGAPATLGPPSVAGRARRSGAPGQAARWRVGHCAVRRRCVMRPAFCVLEVATEIDEYTTTRLARAAVQGGHEVWYVGLGDVE